MENKEKMENNAIKDMPVQSDESHAEMLLEDLDNKEDQT